MTHLYHTLDVSDFEPRLTGEGEKKLTPSIADAGGDVGAYPAGDTEGYVGGCIKGDVSGEEGRSSSSAYGYPPNLHYSGFAFVGRHDDSRVSDQQARNTDRDTTDDVEIQIPSHSLLERLKRSVKLGKGTFLGTRVQLSELLGQDPMHTPPSTELGKRVAEFFKHSSHLTD